MRGSVSYIVPGCVDTYYRAESAYSAVSVNSVIVLAGNEFRLIKGAKRARCDTFPNHLLVLSVCKHMDTKLNSNALKTWPQWTSAIAVNIGNDLN